MASATEITVRNRTKLIVGIDYGTTYSGKCIPVVRLEFRTLTRGDQD